VTVVAFVPDLMDRSRISGVVGDVTFVSSVDGLLAAPADVVVVDLQRVPDLAALAAIESRCIGFAPHVDSELIERARAVGCEAMARSRFFREVDDLIG